MEDPTDEASNPTENERNGGRMSLRRKFTNLLEYFHNPFCTKPTPQDEDVPARKKPRLQVSLPAMAADADSLDPLKDDASVGTDPVAASTTQPNVGATHAPPHRWTPEEDAKLTSAVETTCKKKYCGEYSTDWDDAEYSTDWDDVAALVPGRTKQQCNNRWHTALYSKSDETTTRKSQQWTKQEDSTLTDAVKKHNRDRRNRALDAKKNETTARVGKWTQEEDGKLKDAVDKHNGKDWAAIAALVPGRTKQQCWDRRNRALDAKKNETNARAGKWTKEEDDKLKDAVDKHKNEGWAAISARVSGRTKQQCANRWHADLRYKTDETTACVGKWTAEEDCKLKDAVEKHNGKNWEATAALIPGRTKKQFARRWQYVLDNKSDETTARNGQWTTDEDDKLKGAVEKHKGKDWAAIAELVPGRTKHQCRGRWHRWQADTKSDETTARVGKW
jgi:hypothetical protein